MQPSEEIKQKLDIVDLIREYVPSLRAAGVNFKANCPFHQESTPSFVVSPDKQIWHCFGCGKGGDAFSFIQEIEGISFVEALRVLAPRAGVTLKKMDPKIASQRNRLLDIMEASAHYYHQLLTENPQAESARQYLKKRQLSEETIDDWLIGYSPDSWDDLLNHLLNKGFRESEIFLSGMSIKKEGANRYYNRFRGRIMFPIYDYNNNIVAFTARVSPEREEVEKMGKYINSPQTMLYDKSKVLFGLNRAKVAIRNADLAVIVEGQMDVITAHQHGFKNIVASSGTALTKDQLGLIKRYTTNIALAFDMDEAGQNAADRGMREAMSMEMNIKIITLPNGKDPDDCIKNNPAEWQRAVQGARPMMEYYFDKIFATLNLSEVDQKRKGAQLALNIINKLNNKIERDFWLRKLSGIIDVEENILREVIAKKPANSVVRNKQPIKETESRQPVGRGEALSQVALCLMLKYPSLIEYSAKHMLIEYFVGSENQDVYKSIIMFYNDSDNQITDSNFYFNLKQWITDEKFALNQHQLLDMLVILGDRDYHSYIEDDARKEFLQAVIGLKKFYLQKSMKKVEKMIAEAERGSDTDSANSLLMDLNNLNQELKELNLE